MNLYPTPTAPTAPGAMTSGSQSPPPAATFATQDMAPSAPPPPPGTSGFQPPPPQSSYPPSSVQPPAQTAVPELTKPAPVAAASGATAQNASGPTYYAPPPSNLTHKPVVISCPQCQHRGPSTVTSDNCTAVNWICTLGLCLCCFFCIPATAKHTHTCSKCGGYLGSNNII